MSYQIDEIDSQVIELLQKDGRMMYKDVAKAVGVSLPTVRSRINKLTEMGLIKKFTVMLDFEKIWGRVRAFVIAQSSETDIEKLKQAVSRVPEVRSAFFVAGEKQVLLEVEVEDLHDLSNLISNRLPAELSLSDASSFVVSRLLKEEYGTVVRPNTSLQFKCDFCGCLIYGKPIVEYIGGGRYYFSGQDCSKAYKERKVERTVASVKSP